jgi:hypothetical protein
MCCRPTAVETDHSGISWPCGRLRQHLCCIWRARWYGSCRVLLVTERRSRRPSFSHSRCPSAAAALLLHRPIASACACSPLQRFSPRQTVSQARAKLCTVPPLPTVALHAVICWRWHSDISDICSSVYNLQHSLDDAQVSTERCGMQRRAPCSERLLGASRTDHSPALHHQKSPPLISVSQALAAAVWTKLDMHVNIQCSAALLHHHGCARLDEQLHTLQGAR